MIEFLRLSNSALFVYYLVSNLFYLALLVRALLATARHRRRLISLRLETLELSPFTPPISILVPAHNESATIVENVKAVQALDYSALEIIVINDGSSDDTLALLQSACQLRPASLLYIPQVPSAPVHAIYTSAADPRLLVLDKLSAGTKADAVNAGLNAATSPYVCVIDADSILEPDALLRLMAEIFSDPLGAVAVGGIVRVINGSTVSRGRVSEIRLSTRPVEVLQVIDYLRAFLIGREAWGDADMLPLISGAFGIFRRDLVLALGGYRRAAVGEDIDLVMRMHRWLIERGRPYRIGFVPEPTCWTLAPASLKALGRQRARWQRGLLDVLWHNRDMLFRRRYGRVGWIMLPYLWIFELAAPVVETIGYSTILLAALLGVLSRDFLVQFAIFGYAFATLISIGAVVQEEVTFRRYSRWTEVARLLLYCFAEHFPYRQFNMLWRLAGLWQHLRGAAAWETAERRRFAAGAGVSED